MSREVSTEVKVEYSVPTLKKVELIDFGRDGLSVTYSVRRNRNGVLSLIEKKDKEKRPIQMELRKLFGELREEFLKMCGYYWPNEAVFKSLEKETYVTSVEVNVKGEIQFCGIRKVFGGDRDVVIKGPMMHDTDYEEDEFDKLMEVINKVKVEVEHFMTGRKGADKETIVKDYLAIHKGVQDVDGAFAEMDEEEIEAIMHDAMEEMGLDVVMEDGQMVIAPSEEKVKDTKVIKDLVLPDLSREKVKEDPTHYEELGDGKDEIMDDGKDDDLDMFPDLNEKDYL